MVTRSAKSPLNEEHTNQLNGGDHDTYGINGGYQGKGTGKTNQ